jgi:hypothetical protein
LSQALSWASGDEILDAKTLIALFRVRDIVGS